MKKTRELLRAHMLEGGEVKAFAFDHNMSRTNVGKLLATIGIKKYFLTADEYATVAAKRAKTQGEAAS
jgi:hypothetical protein